MFVRPDRLSRCDISKSALARLRQFHEFGALVHGIDAVGNQPLAFQKIGDTLHTLTCEAKRTRSICNRHG